VITLIKVVYKDINDLLKTTNIGSLFSFNNYPRLESCLLFMWTNKCHKLRTNDSEM